jgi:multiple sugar transport system permease protein
MSYAKVEILPLHSSSGGRRRKIDLFPYFLILPAVLILCVIFLYPLGYSLWLSFFNLNLNRPGRGMPFVGLDNYTDVLSDPDFYHSLWLTVYWTAGSVVGQLLLGLGAALALNETFPGRAVARAVILVPWAVPTVLVAIVFGTMFNTQGIINQLLLDAGLISDYIPWLSSTNWSMPTIIIANVWKGFPFIAVMLLAGLQAIPHEYYEAAKVDGASEWARFRFITLPSLSNVTAVAVLLSIIFALKSVDFQYIMTYGGPADSTKVIAFNAYFTAFGEFLFGKASAIATILTVITAIVSFVYLKQRGVE